ncbi:MAG: hypothetical protein IT372_32645 [Polyangiaceae bacterium]|nr:hypothetical protein [Polyangiaceae bacterium]
MQKQGADKRRKERARQEKQREKEATRLERRKAKDSAAKSDSGEDPDLAGIVPGPQPPPAD